MPIRVIKTTSTAIVTSDFNLSIPGKDMEVNALYTLTDVTISADGNGMAKFSLCINGVSEGITQSFPFLIQSTSIFVEVEKIIDELPQFSDGRIEPLIEMPASDEPEYESAPEVGEEPAPGETPAPVEEPKE
ncbi:hypothetical protein KGP26_07675 [Serratia sp. JSRIV002]|uniref:hypothetical protein n=1 Tax=Serratia sp. JSRIV002 TaxID=2831894 RepID=UPI001CBFD4DA|nr:hypothetical protein [Serratia sp. JSRIV002]UAN52930.1 hypothetical protein KGP26_07675 [Serratia sp. JSRIV002]